MNMLDEYALDEQGRFQIQRFDQQPAFSSFLPGIGGVDGVPLWCMYVNRGQSVVSFGVANKDNSIAEFLPATWAYQLVTTQGFRTFCKIDGDYYEPFQKGNDSRSHDIKRSMSIEPEINRSAHCLEQLKLQILPNEPKNWMSLTVWVSFFRSVTAIMASRPCGASVRPMPRFGWCVEKCRFMPRK
ncbi:MAG: hypothetical protein ACYTBW_03720 [Planctomycetota bacterium]